MSVFKALTKLHQLEEEMAGLDEERQQTACMKRGTAASLAFHAFFFLRGAQEDPDAPYEQHSPVPLAVLITTLSTAVSDFIFHIRYMSCSCASSVFL